MSQRNRDHLDNSRSAHAVSARNAWRQRAAIGQFRELRREVQAVMRALARIAEQRGISYEEAVEPGDEPSVEPLAEVLLRRVRRLDEPFRLAVVGEFSRGKSSLVNALIEREILASDARPNTAAQTILKHGEPDRFTVSFLPGFQRPPETHHSNDLLADLARFTSDAAIDRESENEDANAGYAEILNGQRQSLSEQIERVEVWFQSDLLQRMEIEIIDTPGLGAVFRTHEQVTLRVLHSADAILFTILTELGVDGREVAFIRLIRELVPKMFFVLTKMDQVRDQQELPERVEYARKTLQIKAGVAVEHIFPVSAHMAQEGAYQQSGFPEFLPPLEQFLVRANGITRLLGPLRFTATQARHVLHLQDEYIQRLDRSRAELEQELVTLKAGAEGIQHNKTQLLDMVKERIEDTCATMLDDVPRLPEKIRQNVEAEIAGLSSSNLRQADAFIQAAIKEAVSEWIENRKESFTAGITSLNHTVIKELKKLMDTVQFDDGQLFLIRSIAFEVEIPLDTRQITDDIGDRIVKTLLSAGITSTIATVAGSFVRAAATVFEKVKRGILGFFKRGSSSSSSSSQPQDNMAEVRQRLYGALRDTLPGTSVNTYQAVVEGYWQSGRKIDGVRQVIEKAFTDWGKDLNNDISSLINNNLNTRLHDLSSQLNEQRNEVQTSVEEKSQAARVRDELRKMLQTTSEIERQLRSFGAE